MKKENIRRYVKAHKSLLDEHEKINAARRVFGVLENSAAFVMAKNILMYHSLPDELSTHEFLDRWCNRKNFFLPRVNGVDLDILPYNPANMTIGAFQIEEPTGDDIYSMDDIELVVVPGVAFDSKGNRVGRGKGYYDRLLRDTAATRIGVAYDFQLVDEIETEPHDVGVDVVITSRAVYNCRKERRN